jgi:hypothetical protein
MYDIFAGIGNAFDSGLILPFALLLFAVWMESIWMFAGLILLAYELDWIRVLPADWRRLSGADQWWLLGCWFAMAMLVDELGGLRRAWQERILPRRESGKGSAQSLTGSSGRQPHS